MDSKRFNPFTENTAGEYFVGRESALQLFSASLNGLAARSPSHIYVAGVHGTGKTSYLRKLCEIADERGFAGVYLTLDERPRGHEHIGKILRSIAEKIEARWSLTNNDNKSLTRDWARGPSASIFSHPRSEQIDSGYISKDFDKLKTYIHNLNCSGAVICIDEGQRITPDALSALKNSLQNIDTYLVIISLRLIQDNVSAVIAGRSLLDEKAKEAEGDFGASRFFISGIPMGPFETDQEAHECIRRRLNGNSIQFEDAVIESVIRIAGAIPREMISFSSHIYNNALLGDAELVTVPLLNNTFASVRRSEFRQAQSLCASISGIDRRVLRTLLYFRRPAAIDDLVRTFGDAPDEVKAVVASGIEGALSRIQANVAFCHKTDEGYFVSDPVYRYALQLALSGHMS